MKDYNLAVYSIGLEPLFTAQGSSEYRKENMKNKEQAIINFVLNWLNSNIDDRNASASDSLDLKEKIEMALDPQITIEDIAKGNF